MLIRSSQGCDRHHKKEMQTSVRAFHLDQGIKRAEERPFI